MAVQLHSTEAGGGQKDDRDDFMEAQAEGEKFHFRRKAEKERCVSCDGHNDCSMYYRSMYDCSIVSQ